MMVVMMAKSPLTDSETIHISPKRWNSNFIVFGDFGRQNLAYQVTSSFHCLRFPNTSSSLKHSRPWISCDRKRRPPILKCKLKDFKFRIVDFRKWFLVSEPLDCPQHEESHASFPFIEQYQLIAQNGCKYKQLRSKTNSHLMFDADSITWTIHGPQTPSQVPWESSRTTIQPSKTQWWMLKV